MEYAYHASGASAGCRGMDERARGGMAGPHQDAKDEKQAEGMGRQHAPEPGAGRRAGPGGQQHHGMFCVLSPPGRAPPPRDGRPGHEREPGGIRGKYAQDAANGQRSSHRIRVFEWDAQVSDQLPAWQSARPPRSIQAQGAV
eukprot:scaffold2042_cov45-Prasinocladus_malaysianus.AAC.1